MRFSQRVGRVPVKTVLQIEGIDTDLQHALWSCLLEEFFQRLSTYSAYGEETQQAEYCKIIWKEFFKKPVDTIPHFSSNRGVYYDGFIEHLRKWYYEAHWYEIYDLIEFISGIHPINYDLNFDIVMNNILQKELAGYRLVNKRIIQVTSEEEIQEIIQAFETSDPWTSVSQHLNTALDFLADRKHPDYRNSIKESISSVEAFCKIVTGEGTLGKALAHIEKRYSLHNALKSAFSSLYGYTSDAGGIRHALMEGDTEPSFFDAKFMLVSCSAFINYLKGIVVDSDVK